MRLLKTILRKKRYVYKMNFSFWFFPLTALLHSRNGGQVWSFALEGMVGYIQTKSVDSEYQSKKQDRPVWMAWQGS